MNKDPSPAVLTKIAVKAAINNNWEEAVELNLDILQKEPDNTSAKLRLGKAYIQLKDFNKAKKIFKEVLEKDPINSIALKNMEAAKNKIVTNGHTSHQINQNSLIKEPGTSKEIPTTLIAPRLKASDINPGEVLSYKLLKTKLDIIRNDKTIATIKDKDLLTKLNKLLATDGEYMSVSFKEGENKNMIVLIKTSKALFKTERQDLRPYVKKGSIDEPDLESGEVEEEESEEE